MHLCQFLHSVYVPSLLGISADGIYQLEIVVRQFAAHANNPKISELTDMMVCGFLRECLAQGLSPVTVNSKRAKIVALWNCAWRKRMHADQPRDIPRCWEPHKIPTAWTIAEVSQLVKYASTVQGVIGYLPASWYWSTLIRVCWDTGLRVGAVMQILSEDFYPDGPAVIARSATQKTLIGQCLPLSQSTADAIQEHYDPSRKLIWPWPYCKRQIHVRFRRIIEGAGLTASYKGHDMFQKLRRSHLSYLACESLELARRQAGHTSAATTIKHYIDPRICNSKRAVDVLPVLKIH